MKYLGVGFDASYTPEMINALAAARDKLNQVMTTEIDSAGHTRSTNWWTVIVRSHPAIFSVGYTTDRGSVTPHLVISYDPRRSPLSPPSKEQILDAKGAETTLGDWLIANGLNPTTLVIEAGHIPTLRPALRSFRYRTDNSN